MAIYTTEDQLKKMDDSLRAYFGADYKGCTNPPLKLFFTRDLTAAELTAVQTRTGATVSKVE